MRERKGSIVLALLLGLAQGAGAAGLSLRSAQVRLDGDSSLHPYHALTQEVLVSVSVEAKPKAPAPVSALGLLKAGGVKALSVEVPVATLKSGDSRLDKNMRKALKAADAPKIAFVMEGYDLKEGEAGNASLTAWGRLSVAGKEQGVTLTAEAAMTGVNLELKGSQELRMTDFGIEPPQMMMGIIKTKDKVVISYRLSMELSPP